MHWRMDIPSRSTHAVAAVLCLLLCGSVVLSACADKPAKPKKENRRAESHQIEMLEQSWLQALTKADTAVLEKLMAEDFLAISANGTLSDKQQYLQRVSTGVNSFRSIDVMDIKVRMQPSAAVVVSQVRVLGQLDSHPVNAVFRYTKVYGRASNGQWRVLNLEATRVSGPDEMGMHRGMPLSRKPSPEH
ncbi:nuclear transport factor 2 family protein [Terriglobus sp. RCC_193]|uniref:nuclear transport factor 2 family protein n=1 Tax=Terriglobus sp. RCC_193 TaxID=3239218 RepID=UPI003525D0F9